MSATNHTQNYDLSQFVGGDIPSWLGDYNGDMAKIDAAIAEVASGAGDIASDVNNLKSRMTTAEADIDSAESNIATLQTTSATQGAAITQNTNNIATTNNNVSALDTRVTALENQTGSGLDFTAHAGTPTITPTTGGTVNTTETDLQYGLNDDKSLGKINGSIRLDGSISLTGNDWTTVATLSSADFPTRSTDIIVNMGLAKIYASNVYDDEKFRLVFKQNGDIAVEVYCRTGAGVSTAETWVSLPPCIYTL